MKINIHYPTPFTILTKSRSSSSSRSVNTPKRSFDKCVCVYFETFKASKSSAYVLRYNTYFFPLYLHLALWIQGTTHNNKPSLSNMGGSAHVSEILELAKSFLQGTFDILIPVPIVIPLINLCCLIWYTKINTPEFSNDTSTHKYKYKEVFRENLVAFQTDLQELIDQVQTYTSSVYKQEKVFTEHHNDLKNDAFDIIRMYENQYKKPLYSDFLTRISVTTAKLV